MTVIYKVRAMGNLAPSDPLHVGNFFKPDRLHRQKMQDRQDLILYLAQLHATAIAHCAISKKPRGFCEIQFRLMSLRDWVHNYRCVLDYFFEVKQTGFNFGDGDHEISTLIPKLLPDREAPLTNVLVGRQLKYVVPERPEGGVISKVYIQRQNAPHIYSRLAEENRADLRGVVEWLLDQHEVNFIFKPAGKLQQRDTSVWPISAIETWPSWLRESLFGSGIDIENAYTQFLVMHLRKTFTSDQMHQIFPDLQAAVDNKVQWRYDLCDVLSLPRDETGIAVVKKVCMSLANGSRISPGILSGGRAFSVTAEIVVSVTDNMSIENLDYIGQRLQKISRQYSAAKKVVCNQLLGLNPTRANQKKVFSSYFEWEREARYAIWEMVEHHGIMVHDGIDGIPPQYTVDLQKIIDKIGLKVTV